MKTHFRSVWWSGKMASAASSNSSVVLALKNACSNGDLATVVKLIRTPDDYVTYNASFVKHGNDDLVKVACYAGMLRIVKYMVGMDAVPGRETYESLPMDEQRRLGSYVHAAVESGNPDVALYLLKELDFKSFMCVENSDVMWERFFAIPIVEACRNGGLDMVQMLVDDVGCHLFDDCLEAGIRSQSLPMVRYLFRHPDSDAVIQFLRHDSPVHFACSHGTVAIVHWLIDKGYAYDNDKAIRNILRSYDFYRNDFWKLLPVFHFDPDTPDTEYGTYLHRLLVSSGRDLDFSAIKAVVPKGARTDIGWNPEHCREYGELRDELGRDLLPVDIARHLKRDPIVKYLESLATASA